MSFKEYNGLDLVKLSSEVLDGWKKQRAFDKSLELREGAPEFVFFEGPPSANGRPGIHHVMARSIKDSICRYKTMTGYRVNRRAGWDTHGLPVELGVEKMLGITKEDIGSKISVEEYNAACRKEVMKYTAEWESLTDRIGYWVDMKDPYITYDNRYIETLWYLLKDIYGKGLLYKGYSIQPYSPAAGTGLSTHELNQPGCYRDVKDTTCVAQFRVKGAQATAAEGLPLYFLAWTTTPWTLPSNTALCVGPNIEYVRVRAKNPYSGKEAVYIVAAALVGQVFAKVEHTVLEGSSCRGRDLVGMEYEQLIPWFNPGEGAFRVIPGDYVTTEDGTGVVHIAPTFGADDNKVAKAAGVPPMQLMDRKGEMQAAVDRQGRFFRMEDMDPEWAAANVDPSYAQWAGRYVKNAYDASLPADAPTLDVDLCVMMKADGRVFKIEKHVHTYPHCWRTDKPVLYYPLDSWFIRTTAVREKMMELNDTITWLPEATGTGRFGKWLENIQDWNLSRSRYWGTPLPIWRSEDGKCEKCIGSVAELYEEIEKAVKAGLMDTNILRDWGFVPGDMSKENYGRIDLHRPYVDRIVLVAEDGRTPMKREADLIDVWFDSGAMPYAQEGLRNLGKPCFGQTADFIAEGVDQTRGWFYTLHAINTMVSGKCAYKRVISNGLVLDKYGNKMSKRLGNAVDPFSMLDKYGADAIRWYMLTNAQPWDNLKFDEAGVDEVRRKFFGTLYNSYSFFALYANVDSFDPADSSAPEERSELDRWILSKTNTLIEEVTAAYEAYDVTLAGRLIQDFVCDNLSNWYVRLGRKRFWGGGMTPDKVAAYRTMHKVLVTVAVLGAPIAPFFMDRLYCDLVPGADSVHFVKMPAVDASAQDKELESRMDLAQKASSMVLGLRKKAAINVRKPLAKIVIPVLDSTTKARLEAVKSIILAETNVKEMEFIDNAAGLVTKSIKPNFRTLGKRYGSRMKEIAAEFAKLSQSVIDAIQQAEAEASAYTLSLAAGDVTLESGDFQVTTEDMPGWLVAGEGSLTVALDITLTPALVREGVARELVNRIQNIRKESGFEVTDKVKVCIYAEGADYEEIASSLADFAGYVAAQTLSTSVEAVCGKGEGSSAEWNDGAILINVTKN